MLAFASSIYLRLAKKKKMRFSFFLMILILFYLFVCISPSLPSHRLLLHSFARFVPRAYYGNILCAHLNLIYFCAYSPGEGCCDRVFYVSSRVASRDFFSRDHASGVFGLTGPAVVIALICTQRP